MIHACLTTLRIEVALLFTYYIRKQEQSDISVPAIYLALKLKIYGRTRSILPIAVFSSAIPRR